ncbi:MAG: hypothetical protein WAX77_08875 [Methylococcaceae bacterium]
MTIATKPTTATVFGTVSSSDYLLGTANNDIITGGGSATIAYITNSVGADTMEGSAGNDSYIVDNQGDMVIENPYQGIDTIYTTVSYTLPNEVENIQAVQPASSSGIAITGNSKDNILDSGSQNNISDTLRGFAGNDTYIVDSNDQVIEGNIVTNTTTTTTDYTDSGGVDTIISASTVNISPLITANSQQSNTPTGTTQDKILGAAYIENVLLTGTATANILGNAKDNSLAGNDAVNSIVASAGNDTLDGGIESTAKTDTLVGGSGNDMYIIRNTSDVVNETISGSSGTDVIISTASYTLPLNVENLNLISTATINGTGNILNNVINGNDAINSLIGGDGYDTLNGAAGNDTIDGGTGNDLIFAGTGKDKVTTGTGTDTIKFTAGIADTFATANSIASVDWYNDLTLNATLGDRIDITVPVANIGLAVSGNVSEASFISNMNSLLTSSGKGFVQFAGSIDAVIVNANFTPTTGTTSAKSFLAIDLNASGTFDANDFVIDITGSTITSLTPSVFVTSALFLNGTTGIDILYGRAGNDTITGGLGADVISTGGGNNIIKFASGNVDSYAFANSIIGVDKYTDLNLNDNNGDGIGLTVTVAKVGNAVTGSINERTFVADMNSLLTTAGKGFVQTGGGIDAAIVTANAGSLSGRSFLAVDLDSTGSFTIADFVIEITGSTLTSLTTNTFGTSSRSLKGTTGMDTLYGGVISDNLSGDAGNDSLMGGAGNDILIGGTSSLVTGTGNDTLNGGAGDDNLVGNDGNDSLIGDLGNDSLLGGVGDDTLTANDGNDNVTGDVGNDSIIGGNGNDTLTGGTTTVLTGTGNDTIDGGAGDDSITANDGNDSIIGGAGNDTLIGGSSTVLTGTGNDTIDGSTGDDSITANDGNDSIIGGVGNDTIVAGVGRDSVTVGDGNDVIRFASGVTDSYALSNSIANIDLYSDLTLNTNSSDKIDLTVTVVKVGTAVSGTLNQASFVTNMNTLLTTSVKGFVEYTGGIDAAVVTATAGDLSTTTDRVFLAVDLDSNGTFTATDFVIEITGSSVTNLTNTTFV